MEIIMNSSETIYQLTTGILSSQVEFSPAPDQPSTSFCIMYMCAALFAIQHEIHYAR